ILSGIAQHYTPEEMIGRQVTFIANLAPRKMMGVESQGMILVAEDADGKLRLILPEKDVRPGSQVSRNRSPGARSRSPGARRRSPVCCAGVIRFRDLASQGVSASLVSVSTFQSAKIMLRWCGSPVSVFSRRRGVKQNIRGY